MKSRIRPSDASQWSEETRAILHDATPAAESPDGHGPPNILYTIAHHPNLLPAFLEFTAALALKGVLPRRDAEVLALRTARNCRSAFEWGHHVEYGLAHGLSEAEITSIASGTDHPDWTDRERLLLQTADALPAAILTDGDGHVLRTMWEIPSVSDIRELLTREDA